MSQFAGKHLLVMAGGTGGHVVPGLSCAQSFAQAGGRVSWIGTRKGIESDLVPKAGIDIHYIDVEGLRGKGKLSLLLAPINLLKALAQALKIIKRLKPDVVLGMGGFASGPGGLAAWLCGIPVVIHEQNAVAGTTNKILSKFAKRVLQAFPGAFGDKAQTIGNPVRDEIVKVAQYTQEKSTDKKLSVLALGGSLGALAINQYMVEVFAQLNGVIELKHQAGKRNIDSVVAAYNDAGLAEANGLSVTAFIDDMAEALAWADVVICRAGAMTVSELAAANKPAYFVPYPFAIDDHQSANAAWMVEEGAAQMMQQKDLTAQDLIEFLQRCDAEQDFLMSMSRNAKRIAITDANDKVCTALLEVME